jgi:predicted nuclease of predicted toxin-antitoxin system
LRVRILLDESLPRTLTRHFSGVIVETVFDRGWSGVKNGELLRRAAASFDVFLTADQNLQYQQNLKNHQIRVVILAAVTNRVPDLLPLLDEALAASERLDPGEVLVIRGERR